MNIIRYPDRVSWPGILKRPVMNDSSVDSLVLPVIGDVRTLGDEALIEYTRRFDKVNLTSLKVTNVGIC